MPSVNKDRFISSCKIHLPCISFICLTALAGIFSTELKRRGKEGHTCLPSDLSEKLSLSFSPLSMMLTVRFFYRYYLSTWRCSSLFLAFWKIFSWVSVGFLSNDFSAITGMFMRFVIFRWLMWITFIYFQILNQPLHTWDKSHLVIVYNNSFSSEGAWIKLTGYVGLKF